MKRLILLCFLLSIYTGLTKAQSFDIMMEDTVMYFDCSNGMDLDLINHGFITNNQGNANSLYWVRNEIQMPAGWGSAICDYVRCYFQSVGERKLDLTGGQVSTFDLHLYNNMGSTPPGATIAHGDSIVIEICVFEINDTTTTQCFKTTFICDDNSAIDDENAAPTQELVISPNPATNYFTISNDDEIGKVEVYDIIGAKVKVFDRRSTSIFEVSDLPTGMYLVRTFDKNAKMLSTLRLKKR